jgi:hypothetical protein
MSAIVEKALRDKLDDVVEQLKLIVAELKKMNE